MFYDFNLNTYLKSYEEVFCLFFESANYYKYLQYIMSNSL